MAAASGSSPAGGATVNGSIERTHVDANTGAGVRVDGTGGGSSNVAITDSSVSLNGSLAVNAVSGPSGNVKVDLTRVVIANNNGAGVQSNNGTGGTVDRHGRPVDAVEQHLRLVHRGQRTAAKLPKQPGDRPGRHGSDRGGITRNKRAMTIGPCGTAAGAFMFYLPCLTVGRYHDNLLTKSTFFSALLGALFVAGLAIAPAHAQATRTWVSGVGDDANPCSRTAPCKTWAGAISKTATGGEIDALDPGGFGTLTITKSITLDGGGGQVASILASGVNGINISAAGGVVILRNLRINGAGGTTGVAINSAATVVIEKCDIFGFTAGRRPGQREHRHSRAQGSRNDPQQQWRRRRDQAHAAAPLSTLPSNART